MLLLPQYAKGFPSSCIRIFALSPWGRSLLSSSWSLAQYAKVFFCQFSLAPLRLFLCSCHYCNRLLFERTRLDRVGNHLYCRVLIIWNLAKWHVTTAEDVKGRTRQTEGDRQDGLLTAMPRGAHVCQVLFVIEFLFRGTTQWWCLPSCSTLPNSIIGVLNPRLPLPSSP